MERAPHPLQAWLDKQGVSYAEASKRVRRKVAKIYIEQICRGYYEPSFEVARVLSERLTGGEVSLLAIKDYPYTRRPKRRVA